MCNWSLLKMVLWNSFPLAINYSFLQNFCVLHIFLPSLEIINFQCKSSYFFRPPLLQKSELIGLVIACILQWRFWTKCCSISFTYIQGFHSRDNVFQEMERINKTFFKPLLAQDIQGKVIDKYVWNNNTKGLKMFLWLFEQFNFWLGTSFIDGFWVFHYWYK